MIKKAENIIVGISIGDLNGIGSEVVLKTFEDSRMLEVCTPLLEK
jgi:4-hydroxythreonine-4-phosphate dehydrogenase